jgi:hypothetical protein
MSVTRAHFVYVQTLSLTRAAKSLMIVWQWILNWMSYCTPMTNHTSNWTVFHPLTRQKYYCADTLGETHDWWRILSVVFVLFNASVTLRFKFKLLPRTQNLLGWVYTCNVTAYRNTVSWECGRNSCPRNVSKVGYAVTLRSCSVCCRYLTVASKGWYGYGQSRRGRATWRCASTPAPAVTVSSLW